MDGDQLIAQNDVAMSRRGVLTNGTALGVGVGIALAARSAAAQNLVITKSEGMIAGVVNVNTPDGKAMPAYRAMPATGQGFGVVLVVQEIFGVHAYIADVCRRFAAAGWYAIAPELYFRQGDPKYITDIPAVLRDIVAKVPDGQVMGDLDAAVAFARGEGRGDTNKLGVTGFCWGGRITWLYAA